MKSIILSTTIAAGLMITGSVMAIDMPPLAKKNNCVACHAVDHKVVGPAWQDIGKKYPLLEGLVMKVSKGGSGHWGSMPMPANDPTGKKQDEIKQLVQFELSLA